MAESLMPFELDAFQKKSIELIDQDHSVLVSAPTGAGKTVVAEYAIDKALSKNKAVIYTAPIKALSNQKYRDFRAKYGDDSVGILTGDVSINPDAPILIMTTEIYRNSLFENSDRIEKTGWVIFDEIHYLDDPERGTVWEEAILFTPPEIRILALSATVPNIHMLAEWIRSIHEGHLTVVEEDHRPVPLQFNFQCQGKILENLKDLRRDGFLNRDNWHLTWKEKRRGFMNWKAKPNRLDHLIEHLIEKNRLPAIYFAFGRRKTETMAWEAAQFDFLNEKERTEIISRYDELLIRYDLEAEKTALDMRELIHQGIAYHHAGMLPTLKEVIEQLFTSKLIKLIFTTETFALGINMPARTVIFDELEKFYGVGFKYLTTRDFFQMAGRAGRRGMDDAGFVYSRIHPNDIPFPEIQRIIFSKPEGIRSQLNTAYATLLNLYRDLGPELIKIYPKTFHYFQSHPKRRQEGLSLIENRLRLLEDLGHIKDGDLTPKGEFGSSLFGYELMLSELHEAGDLESLDEAGLSVLLCALIYEPRKGVQLPRLTKKIEKIEARALHHSRHIYRAEAKLRISPYTKQPHFHMSLAVEAWIHGADFDKLIRLADVDEGEMVRYLRMVIQLLRELIHAPGTSETLKARAQKARGLINRDVVDAEKQLRI